MAETSAFQVKTALMCAKFKLDLLKNANDQDKLLALELDDILRRFLAAHPDE